MWKPPITLGSSLALVALGALTACGSPPQSSSPDIRARYVGVGTYSAGEMWSKLAAGRPKTPKNATPADDEHVIVVEDTKSGEIRECGDYSGVCLKLEPWTAEIPDSRSSPVIVETHRSQIGVSETLSTRN